MQTLPLITSTTTHGPPTKIPTKITLGAAVPATADRICVLNSNFKSISQAAHTYITSDSSYSFSSTSSNPASNLASGPKVRIASPRPLETSLDTPTTKPSHNMADTLSSTIAFPPNHLYNPQATISLSDTTLHDSLMTPEPTSPESSYHVKEESVQGDESRKPTKKRKSWGQELPTPKTNLPPRYVLTVSSSLLTSTHIHF